MTDREWAGEVREKILQKYEAVAPRNEHKVPYSAKNGVFDDHSKDIAWSTNGFWGGILWQLYKVTEKPLYRSMAEELESKMDEIFLHAAWMDHDSGFRWLPTASADYTLTGSEEAKNRIRIAADNLAGRFNLNGRFIRAWNEDPRSENKRTGWAIIDCMMNLPLLYRASDLFDDPRWKAIAVAHADTAMTAFIRPDGSSNHIVAFDPVKGGVVRTYGGQGIQVGSSWTRGQTWALYGFTRSYVHTKDEKYLATARKVADRYIERIPADGRIPVDFDQAPDCDWEDETSAAIAACGLLTLEKILADTDPAAADRYHAAAMRLLKVLVADGNFDPAADEILDRCSGAYHDKEHNFPIIYGDYYLIEAIWKLTGDELFIW